MGCRAASPRFPAPFEQGAECGRVLWGRTTSRSRGEQQSWYPFAPASCTVRELGCTILAALFFERRKSPGILRECRRDSQYRRAFSERWFLAGVEGEAAGDG